MFVEEGTNVFLIYLFHITNAVDEAFEAVENSSNSEEVEDPGCINEPVFEGSGSYSFDVV